MLSSRPNRNCDAESGKDWTLNNVGGWAHGFYCTQGRRPYMEDMFHYVQMKKTRFDWFGVYDGHGGVLAAQWLCDYLASAVEEALSTAATRESVEHQLRESFLAVDSELVERAAANLVLDGSCALCVLLRDRELVVANLGDSRAVLSRLGQALALTDDHKPSKPAERERILSRGGTVEVVGVARVNGVLGTSRSFGDGPLKIRGVITAEPDVFCRDLSPGDDFVVMGSDGLWDVVSNQTACDIASRCADPREAAKALVDEAIRLGSNDNITVAVIDLRAAFSIGTPPPFNAAASSSPSCSEPLSPQEQHLARLPFSPEELMQYAPTFSGWLSKQQAKKSVFGSRQWQQRWYSLHTLERAPNYEGSLHHKWSMVFVVLSYHTSPTEQQGGRSPPRKAQLLCPAYAARREPQHDSEGRFFVSVQELSSGKVLLLAAAGEKEAATWIQAFNACLASMAKLANGGPPCGPSRGMADRGLADRGSGLLKAVPVPGSPTRSSETDGASRLQFS